VLAKKALTAEDLALHAPLAVTAFKTVMTDHAKKALTVADHAHHALLVMMAFKTVMTVLAKKALIVEVLASLALRKNQLLNILYSCARGILIGEVLGSGFTF